MKIDDGYTFYEKNYLTDFKFPTVPQKLLDWITLVIENTPGNDYSYIPYQFWIPIIRNRASRKALLFARQLFKTTYFGFETSHIAAKKKRATTCYVAPDEDKLSTFADQKYRSDMLDASPLLKSMIKGHSAGLPGNRSKVQWKNGSFNWHVTDEGGYKKVEGKSGDLIIYDEIQEHDLDALPKAQLAQSKKLGDEIFGGVGGEYGSAWERLWLETTQSEWHYDKDDDYVDTAGKVWPGQGWRNDLQFGLYEDSFGEKKKGLIYGDYMSDVCRGEWIESAPENYQFPGWHLAQTQACHIPLSMSDSKKLYNLDPSRSIEYMEMTYPRLLAIAHIHGGFYKAPRKPLSRQDCLNCMEPYDYLYFFSPADIAEFKQTFPGRIILYMGIDWGSGNTGSSETVITIMMKWLGVDKSGSYNSAWDRFFIIFQERLPYSMSETMEEAYYAIELFNKYYVDFGVADLGYGAKQVKAIIDGGIHPVTGEKIRGLTLSKFIGAWSRGKPTMTVKDKPTEIDDEGSEEVSHLLLDKTQFVEGFVDMVKWKVMHPGYLNESQETQERFSRTKLAIPYGDQWRVTPLINDMTSIERIDIEADILITKSITKQNPKAEYGHPADSVVSMANCFVASNHFKKFGEFKGYSKRGRSDDGAGPAASVSPLFGGTRANRFQGKKRNAI
jgi:hypothetical protein